MTETGPSAKTDQTVKTIDFNSRESFLDAMTVGKRVLNRPAAYEAWDFLKGAGPSAPDAGRSTSVPRQRFTPHGERWDSRRPVGAINPDEQRLQLDTLHEVRRQTSELTRLDSLTKWDRYNNFHVISGVDDDPPGFVRDRRQRMNFIAPPSGQRGKKAVPIEMRLAARTDGWEHDPRYAKRAAVRRDIIAREGVVAPWRASVKDCFRP